MFIICRYYEIYLLKSNSSASQIADAAFQALSALRYSLKLAVSAVVACVIADLAFATAPPIPKNSFARPINNVVQSLIALFKSL